ncbi:cytochrome P450 87A3-like [Dioscorea cayenensis subsp. rotundata]|uniref:Cytochrome P450 87A3-like n=1 Tax=Dioscorea cayennensis subsp. rotundata TaxID=55577 RepID=A0AB40B4F5_DIOCR|nr:cytochrome P450 87A3-like [Dioscorea cayenensis subsp. rotundata]
MLNCFVLWSVTFFLSLSFTHWIYKWKHHKSSGRLPPGSLGLPLFGETFSFFSPNTSLDIAPFMKSRIKRYGPIFKTSILGEYMVVSTDTDFNNFIFQQEGRLFQSWYPETFTRIFGVNNMSTLHGFMYKYLKNLILSLFGVDSLKEKLLPDIKQFAIKRLHEWSCQPSIKMREESSAMIFDLTAKKLISHDSRKSLDNLRDNFNAFIEGLLSFPINFPGTSYYKCIQFHAFRGEKNVISMMKKLLNERRRCLKEGPDEDFFNLIIKELEKEGTQLTEDIAFDIMFVILFASYETTSLSITMAVKFLTDHPKVLSKLEEEHKNIIKNRVNPSSGITWNEYKSMIYTSHVINETMRLANIAPAIFRKTMQDIMTKDGYTIPAGWAVMVCPSATHLDPNIYEDPCIFYPLRWEKTDATVGSKYFMAFGGGMRFCVGADFSRLQTSVFLHHLVTKYRWIAVKGGEIVRTPGLKFPNGFHINLIDRE